ncbi:Bro-N domain-containing protein [Mammaliicoccus vitulinus]|uniref:BRO-N domain-containing protein n=1 Tax=Mammaliicoccus vitulinus TaxID=71237 RepID=UPI00194FC827|nr:Bro-N domain-containing protein [Mammaliicoccus vitulinus]MBM6630322.1 Bro-N domain-containing protein [Mammaliicoccus vitulinus]
MENIKVEEFLGNEIRFVKVNNEWWAVAGDVAKSLGYNKTTNMNRMIDEDDKGAHIVHTPGGSQKVTIISEFGIYEAILNSRKDEAKEFKKWVKQIIKSLRESVGLEQYEVFRMMDKQIQKEASRFLQDNIENAESKHHMKAQAITNKAVSNKFGISPSIKKPDMTPDMLVARQPILNDTVELMVAKDKYNLDLSVSKAIYAKHN